MLAVALVLGSFAGCASKNGVESGETIVITDMAGNTVELPTNIEKIACQSSTCEAAIITLGKGALLISDTSDGVSKRSRNFDYADQLAEERHVPELSDGYSALDSKKWRTENKFSWDEQVNDGYNLVPTVIHGNLSHTGLVST